MRILIALCAMLLLQGCERAMHDMYDQPKYKPGSASPLFADGRAGRAPPIGTVLAVRDAQMISPGKDDYLALLHRGRSRYDIYCAPCHGLAGEGDGMVVARGFPAPPPFTRPDLMNATDVRLVHAIQRGYGVMYPFADRVDAHDREAIVAYIRALQLSQHAPAEKLDAQDRVALQASAHTTHSAR